MDFPFQILADNDFDVVGFGTNSIDYLIRVPEYPVFNSKLELTEYTRSSGGEIASTMTALSRLGFKTAYAGRFGGDREGELGRQSLTDAGVDLRHAETVADARTQAAFIVIDEKSGERTILWHRDKKLSYSADDSPVEAAARGRVLHMTPHDTDACIALAVAAREHQIIVSLDIDNVFDGLGELLPLVDICITSADLPRKLLGISDKRTAMSEMSARYGCAVVGTTLGRSGSIVLCGETFIETPGFDVPGGCVDTTGAGDAWRAGFLYGMLTGENIDESARIANAVAALKCRSTGAISGLPGKHELNSLLKKQ